jgi:membrane protein implicated in regulation of membrane protease activity
MNQPLAETIFWIAAFACIIAEIAILRSTYAARRVEKSALVPAAGPRGEITWALIPALGLSLLLLMTWRKIEARDAHMRMMDHSGMGSMQMPGTTPPAATR